ELQPDHILLPRLRPDRRPFRTARHVALHVRAPAGAAGGEGTVSVPAPELSVVVLSWNTRELLLACLRALFAEQPRHGPEVSVVDNASADGSADAVAAAFPQVQVIRNAENRLYAAANNQGARAGSGEYVCLLNSDTEVRPQALDTLVDFLQQ